MQYCSTNQQFLCYHSCTTIYMIFLSFLLQSPFGYLYQSNLFRMSYVRAIIFFNQTGMYLYGIYLSTIFSCINLCWFLLVQINVITHVTARNSTSPNNKKNRFISTQNEIWYHMLLFLLPLFSNLTRFVVLPR